MIGNPTNIDRKPHRSRRGEAPARPPQKLLGRSCDRAFGNSRRPTPGLDLLSREPRVARPASASARARAHLRPRRWSSACCSQLTAIAPICSTHAVAGQVASTTDTHDAPRFNENIHTQGTRRCLCGARPHASSPHASAARGRTPPRTRQGDLACSRGARG